MVTVNLYAAWLAMLLGGVAGALQGIRFRNEEWLGGYGSWPRRMMRLGHVSFFGLGLLNLAFASSAAVLGLREGLAVPSILLLVGLITMPLVCYLSAVKDAARHLFFIPVLSVLGGIATFLLRMASS